MWETVSTRVTQHAEAIADPGDRPSPTPAEVDEISPGLCGDFCSRLVPAAMATRRQWGSRSARALPDLVTRTNESTARSCVVSVDCSTTGKFIRLALFSCFEGQDFCPLFCWSARWRTDQHQTSTPARNHAHVGEHGFDPSHPTDCTYAAHQALSGSRLLLSQMHYQDLPDASVLLRSVGLKHG
jgi:hypothetical protein